jgi:histidinol-phosphatase
MHEEVTAAIAAARAAGEVAMRYYAGGFEVTIKPDQTPVTQADREAEQAIKRVLGRAFPNHGFLGEELGEEGPKDRRWIIDPIDGTRNFIRRVPIWAVLIGLEEAGGDRGRRLQPGEQRDVLGAPGRRSLVEGERLRASGSPLKDASCCTPISISCAPPATGTASCACSTVAVAPAASGTTTATA